MCGFCDKYAPALLPFIENASERINPFTDEELDMLAELIFAGIVTTDNLSFNLYNRTAEKLTKGAEKGYGVAIADTSFGGADYYMLRDIRQNIYIFSGAKTYQQIRDVSDLLINGDRFQTFSEFKAEAKKILTLYNENYLRTEYNNALSQANSAQRWQEIQEDKELFPMLTYVTVGDNRVRPTHEELDGITRPVDDKFWYTHYPPNDWNCRCDAIQTDDKATSLKGIDTLKDVPPEFRFNAGIDRIVFSPKHPYFKVAKGDRDKAKRNFGLPLP